MACGGHCNHCPSHGGYDPPLSPISWTDDPLDSLDNIRGYYHFYYLAYYIDYELNRRGDSPPSSWWNPITDAYYASLTDQIIYSADYKMLRTGLRDALNDGAWTGTYNTDAYLAVGQSIYYQSTTEMRDKLNDLRTECLCNCNYSCTCNCNYCTCNCNYSCTCDCNYSDRRLKTDIKYL